MRRIKTTPWDAAEHIETRDEVLAYLEAAFEESGDPHYIAAVLDDVHRSPAMRDAASEAGLHGGDLDGGLKASGKTDFDSVMQVLRSLGIRLRAEFAVSGTSESSVCGACGAQRGGTETAAAADERGVRRLWRGGRRRPALAGP